MNSNISFYLATFFRRIHYFLIVFLLISAASITAARLLPAVYEASARLLVESPQIPSKLAAPTVQTTPAEELQIIEQRLMTRANLLDIARSENVFENIDQLTADQIVRRMRDATTIRRTAGRNQATLMNIKFAARNGRIAANVVNRFVTLVLQDNAKSRAQRAGDTLQFFQAEVDRLGTELQKQSAKILQFKNAHSDSLPSTLNYRLQQQSNLQQRLLTTQQNIANLEDQKRKLVDLFEKTGKVSNVTNVNLTPEQRQLANLQDQLRTALAVYSPTNPKVKMLEAQIAKLEPIVAEQAGATGPGSDPEATIFDVQVAALDAQVEVFTQQAKQIEDQLAALKDTIDRTPETTIALDALNRDYVNIQNQYNTAVSRLAQAATGERIELLSKGRRIVVLEQAVAPSEPARPNRPLIAIGGTVMGAMLGLALVIGLEMLNRSIRRPVDITRRLGITPITTVPYIRTPMEMVVRRATFAAILTVIVVGVPAILYAIDTYYLPLDLIVQRVTESIKAML